MIHFDSDYMAGAHPRVMERLLRTNMEESVGYGSDEYTRNAVQKIRLECSMDDADVYFLVGGTQTNATVIDALLRRHEGVLAAESGHINVHEAGAVEATGHKVLTLPQYEGKVKASDVDAYIKEFYADETYEHMVAPGMLYISQPTEYGTVYSIGELTELSEVCHSAGIPLYMDGARLSYALSSEGCDFTLADIARLCDVFYIGGTKAGAMMGEAVVARKGVLKNFFPLVKQHGALLAKGRLLGVQFDELFTDDLYMEIGRYAVRLAMKIKKAFLERGYEAVVDSSTNQQFFRLPNEILDSLKNHATFELWGTRGETHTVVRFVTSWSTREKDVDTLIELIK